LACLVKTFENVMQSYQEVVGQRYRHVIRDRIVLYDFKRELHRLDRRLVLLDKILGGASCQSRTPPSLFSASLSLPLSRPRNFVTRSMARL
jgi:hypothetical protein